MLRPPAVAGAFYSASPAALAEEVTRYLDASTEPHSALGVICPHAGLMYSGHVAGAVLSRVTVPPTVILLGPNHTGRGPAISVYPKGAWDLPGGAIPVDEVLAERLLVRFPWGVADTVAHQSEHCLEVQLPFLRRLRPDLKILPVVIGTSRLETCQVLGESLAAITRELTETGHSRPLLLASTDMSHYEPDDVTRAKDRYALAAIERLDPAALGEAVRTHRITMCGFAPTLSFLHAARGLGASRATLVRYATSGEVNQVWDRVVGYAGFVVS
ncbi:MAG: AmmeMemoRadiSam system protein B [Nitrospirales bacterium]